MSHKCSVCKHPKRKEIEEAILNGVPFRTIAERYGMSHTSIIRHRDNGHIAKALVKAHEVKEVIYAKDLLEKVLYLQEEALEILNNAKKVGNPRIALEAIGRASQLLELQGKIAGQLREQQAVQVNIFANPQFLVLQKILLETLDPYPELKAKIAEALKNVGSDSSDA